MQMYAKKIVTEGKDVDIFGEYSLSAYISNVGESNVLFNNLLHHCMHIATNPSFIIIKAFCRRILTVIHL